MPSLQDQLLKAGLSDKKKAKKIQQEKRGTSSKQKGKKKKAEPVELTEAQQAVAQAEAEQAKRDRELNRQKNEAAAAKALQAQIAQLITMNALRLDGEIAYRFVDGAQTATIYVTEDIRKQLSKGRLAVVKLGEDYKVVPAGAAEKISTRDASYVISLHEPESNEVDEDDPYAEYQIPDDLHW